MKTTLHWTIRHIHQFGWEIRFPQSAGGLISRLCGFSNAAAAGIRGPIRAIASDDLVRETRRVLCHAGAVRGLVRGRFYHGIDERGWLRVGAWRWALRGGSYGHVLDTKI